MGLFLKIVGVLALIWFGLVAVGCVMIRRGAGPAGHAARSAYQETLDRAGSPQTSDGTAVAIALRDDQIDVAQLPSHLETGSEVMIPLRDGTTRILRDSPRDKMLRALLALKADVARHGSDYGDAASDAGGANQRHFKPGEPMLDPTPSAQ